MTQAVDYDVVAEVYDQRYQFSRLDAVEALLQRFIDNPYTDAAEVGCGTGHWLATLRGRVARAAGLDLSMQMLQRARRNAPSSLVVRGRAEQLPWADRRFDRLYCINAMHHFNDAPAFLAESRRVLKPTGALMIVGLDPHPRLDRWWVYDYFPAALEADLVRYASAAVIRDRLAALGFVRVTTEIAQHIDIATPFAVAVERGLVDRRATSQLMVVRDAEYEAGMRRLRTDQPVLRVDLRLYAIIAWTA